MKILLHLFLLLTLLPGLVSCANNKFLDKPENTNLLYWITQKVENDSFKYCTYLPGWFGASEYLDERYKPIIDEGGINKAPAVHVTYLVTGYPDLKDNACVTKINITDYNIYVYGLTINSAKEEINQTMINIGFTVHNNGGDILYYGKNNVVFGFSKDEITIEAATTNKTGIIY